MNTRKATANYAELTGDVYSLIAGAFGSGNKRALDYWKSVWDIASRPYSSVTIESIGKANLERANEFRELAVGELRSAGRESAELDKRVLAESSKAQGMALESFRELLDAYATNLPYVRESESATFDALSSDLKRLETSAAPAGGTP